MKDLVKKWYALWLPQYKKSVWLMTPKCPRCDSTNLNTVKVNPIKDFGRLSLGVMSPITLFFNKPKRPLKVCKQCGFSWEDR